MKSKESKPKILVVLGPTASGKSDLAVQLALKYHGEVVSADSRQVYKGLNVGTGKITKKEMLGVPHHLLDVTTTKKRFTVSDFKKLADEAIADIIARGKLPILCGGTGFYIDAVVNNVILPEVAPNLPLRKKLEKKSSESLFEILKKIDSKRASKIDPRNKVRLIRAIEIAKELGKVPAIKTNPKYNVLLIGISTANENLKERITKRLHARLKIGMINEAKKLHAAELSWKRMYELGLEYRYLSLYLQNKISKDEFINLLNTEIWHYARRQISWFKRDKNIQWFSLSQKTKINSAIKNFLK